MAGVPERHVEGAVDRHRADRTGEPGPHPQLRVLEDPIVPPEQSSAFADALLERGIACTYLAFEGESHGFRRAETRTTALAAELAFYQQIFS
ncbi:prolyl oligopeptidase family serine peptidase [Nonomuraea sp. NPDC055795]